MCAGGNGLAMYKFDLTKPVSEAGSVEKPTLLWTQQMPGVTHGPLRLVHVRRQVPALRPRAGRRLAPRVARPRARSSSARSTSSTRRRARPRARCCTRARRARVRTARGTTSTSCRPRPATTRRSVPTSRASRCSTSRTRPLRRRSPTPTRPRCRPTPPTTGIVLGGDWSTYWHNGTIYQSDIKRGVLSWQLNLGGDATATQANAHLKKINTFAQSNPQTQAASYAPDASAPTITVGRRRAGGFKVGAVGDADFTCADDVGVESCVGSVASGTPLDTSKLGIKSVHGHGHRHGRQHHDEDRHLHGQQHRRPGDGQHGGTVEATMGLSLPSTADVRRVHARRGQVVRGHRQRDDQLDRGDTTLTVYDPATTNTGRLVNGTSALDHAAAVARQRHAGDRPRRRPGRWRCGPDADPVVRGSAAQPRADAVPASADRRPTRRCAAGTYGKTLTFTMSTTTP